MAQNKIISQIEHWSHRYKEDVQEKTFFGKPTSSIKRAEERLLSPEVRSIAYFSMEYGLAPNIYNPFTATKPQSKFTTYNGEVFSNLRAMDYFHRLKVERPPDLPIYSGGLGVLAGDTLKSAADLDLSLVGVGILWHEGYFDQKFLFHDGQVPHATLWDPYSFPGLVPLKQHVNIQLKQDNIFLRLWKYYVYSYDEKNVIPLVLLDAHVPENKEEIRKLTYRLYRSDDEWWKFLQRTILGVGGILALDALGYSIDGYHLNEGHAAFAYVQKARGLNDEDRRALQEKFGYTCHTPVAAGHDRFSITLSEQVLPDEMIQVVRQFGSDPEQQGMINLTRLAMNSAHQINAVSQLHGKVTQLQFPDFKDKLKAITNGVHHLTWMSDSVSRLLDEYEAKIGPWRKDPTCLKKVKTLTRDQEFRQALWKAHQENKTNLCNLLSPWKTNANVFTIAWARRIAGYKRPGLLFHDMERLIEIAKSIGPIQIIIAGKAHPNDNVGRSIISDMLNQIDKMNMLYQDVKILMLENYDTYFGKLLTSSVDVWLNNPLPPFEASGTSGMKALLNGVLQLSTFDGWVAEAADAGIGKIFGYRAPEGAFDSEYNLRLDEDSKKLYKALKEFVELYYQTNRDGVLNADSEWINMMIHCIENAAFFNTHRMVKEYAEKMWNTSLPSD